jgi:hypothetical protein
MTETTSSLDASFKVRADKNYSPSNARQWLQFFLEASGKSWTEQRQFQFLSSVATDHA